MYTFEGDQAGYKTGHPTQGRFKMLMNIIFIYFCVGINCLRTSTNDGALAALRSLIGLLCKFILQSYCIGMRCVLIFVSQSERNESSANKYARDDSNFSGSKVD